MSHVSPILANILPAAADYLSKGKSLGDDVTLTVGPVYSLGFLIGGPVLFLIGLVLVFIMYGRVKYFALEYGDGGFGGRMRSISGYIVLAAMLGVVGGYVAAIGWNNLGYSVTLNAAGLTEKHRGETFMYRWDDLKKTSDTIKSTDFWLNFERDERICQVHFLQVKIGETLQDKAIAITESSMPMEMRK